MTVRATSILAYNEITTSGLLSKKRMQVYKVLYRLGKATGSQVAQEYKSHYPSASHSESIRNRITELVQQGVVRVTANLPTKLPKKATKRAKKEELLSLIKDLGTGIDKKYREELLTIYYKAEKI
jgi:hypothetical protein